MSNFINNTETKLKWQVGLETDIGGGRENQDDCFVWIKKDTNIIVLCVLDGHGREVGRIASEAAKSCIFRYLDENYEKLMDSPADFLIRAHEIAHNHIRDSFKVELERQGFEVVVTDEGFLMKRKSPSAYWSCIHGGTSCSMVALINNSLYIANVGDSTGILCSTKGVFRVNNLIHLQDAAVNNAFSRASISNNHQVIDQNNRMSSFVDMHSDLAMTSSTLIVTAEHSPECPYEYKRLHRFRSRDGNTDIPALVIVYDSSSAHDKSKCSSVFERGSDGNVIVTNKGSYYKNVRKEWASLVSTPPYAKFQDALAFTRSLGDLHLHTYGVTHLPEVQKIDLDSIYDELTLLHSSNKDNSADQQSSSSNSMADEIASSTLCLVLATDGVWDNWLYEDVNKFVMDSSCLNAVATDKDGAKRVALSFMQRNAYYAKKNFGNSADNATGIVLYISKSANFPSSIV